VSHVGIYLVSQSVSQEKEPMDNHGEIYGFGT
jgi:hypothetical protein